MKNQKLKIRKILVCSIIFFLIIGMIIIISSLSIRNNNDNGYYKATYSFTDDIVDKKPIGWNIYDLGGTVHIKEEKEGHKKIVEMYDVHTIFRTKMWISIPNCSYGIYEFWFNLNDTAKNIEINLDGSQSDNHHADHQVFIYTDENYLKVWNGNELISIGEPIVNNQWYHIKVEFDYIGDHYGLQPNTFHIYKDGIKYGIYNFHATTSISAQFLYIMTGHKSSQYCLYIDAIDFSMGY